MVGKSQYLPHAVVGPYFGDGRFVITVLADFTPTGAYEWIETDSPAITDTTAVISDREGRPVIHCEAGGEYTVKSARPIATGMRLRCRT